MDIYSIKGDIDEWNRINHGQATLRLVIYTKEGVDIFGGDCPVLERLFADEMRYRRNWMGVMRQHGVSIDRRDTPPPDALPEEGFSEHFLAELRADKGTN